MKRIFLIVSILFLLIGCNKEEEISLEQKVIGKWQLIEEYSRISSSDRTIQWAPILDGEILTFKEDFTYLNTSYQCVGTYAFYISSDISPYIDKKLPCLNNGIKSSLQFEINGDEMILYNGYNPCRYGCYNKYRRIE
jgi:hypothetical protein